ncbi:MAG: phospholipase D family protein, partial [Verrucomicrobiaceae bacterium]
MTHLLPLAACCLVVSCARLPDTSGRPQSQAIRENSATELGRAVRPITPADSRESAFHPLGKGDQAFAARMGLAAGAERSLDVQYYIWHADVTGKKLIGGLLAAADRGVRVRVLIDDLGTSAKDENLLALDSHPGIEVRLFNPIMTRSARLLGTVFDFGRVNRRMHNKAFIADNQVAIVGGRNIGDEYFDAHSEVNFADFDVAAVGPVVREVSRSFDEYWNSPSSIDITSLTKRRSTPEELAALRASLAGTGREGDAFATKLRRGGI